MTWVYVTCEDCESIYLATLLDNGSVAPSCPTCFLKKLEEIKT